MGEVEGRRGKGGDRGQMGESSIGPGPDERRGQADAGVTRPMAGRERQADKRIAR